MTVRMIFVDRLRGKPNADQADNIGNAVSQRVQSVCRQAGALNKLPGNDFYGRDNQVGNQD